MNSPFLPLPGAASTTSCIPGPAGVDGVDALLAASDAMLHIEAARGGPPPVVLEQIARAAEIEEALSASGCAVRFHTDPDRGRTTIELSEESAPSRRLSADQAAALAAGEYRG